MIPVNLTAVFVAALASMAVGFAWYSKAVFGKRWLNLTGLSSDNMKGPETAKTFGLTFLAALVMAYMLSIFIHYAGAKTVILGAKTGLWVWIGFLVPMTLTNTLFSKKSMELSTVEAGSHLASLLVMGAIIGSWV